MAVTSSNYGLRPWVIYLLPASNYGYTSVAFAREQGALTRIQTPEKDTNIRLSSMGLHNF